MVFIETKKRQVELFILNIYLVCRLKPLLASPFAGAVRINEIGLIASVEVSNKFIPIPENPPLLLRKIKKILLISIKIKNRIDAR